MASGVNIQGSSCYLKDRDNKILLPKTNSSLVVCNDGKTVEEKIEDIVDVVTLTQINAELTQIKEDITRLHYDIGTTSNYYKLKDINNKASQLIQQIEDIKSSIKNMENIEYTLNTIDSRFSNLQLQINNLYSDITTHSNNTEGLIQQLTTRLSELEKKFEEFPTGKIITVEKTVVEDESGLLVKSLLSITDMYEDMCDLINGYSNRTPKESVIDAYYQLYKMEIKQISDMPTQIQDSIAVKLL